MDILCRKKLPFNLVKFLFYFVVITSRRNALILKIVTILFVESLNGLAILVHLAGLALANALVNFPAAVAAYISSEINALGHVARPFNLLPLNDGFVVPPLNTAARGDFHECRVTGIVDFSWLCGSSLMMVFLLVPFLASASN